VNYLLDTNILLHLVRKSPLKAKVEQEFRLHDTLNTVLISVVSLGEIKSLGIQNQWGERRIQVLNAILKEYLVADINSEDVIARYAEIDAFTVKGNCPINRWA
jgi:tRNA(fMet)-specific endonuclease VapC